MDTLQRIFELMNKKGINALNLEKALGFSNATISSWKSGKAKPSADALSKIADYFDVSVDYLLGRETNDQTTSKDIDLEKFRDILTNKGLGVNDIKNLSESQMNAIAEIIKNFK